MRGLHLIACLTVGLTVAACGGMPPEQDLRVLTPQNATTRGGSPAVEAGSGDRIRQGSAVTLVALARQHEARLQALLEDVKQRVARGEATVTDVAQVESRLAAASARRAALEGELAASCARYRELVGHAAPGCTP